ncbi:MAG: PDZ domain-containing protein, partial [Planctomycetota bacterium]
YKVEFPQRQNHYVEVTAVFPTSGQTEHDIMLAVWTPGSYLVREYQRHLENLVASTVPMGDAASATLPLTKVDKNRWRVQTDGTTHYQVRYRVYGRELSVRTNWVEEAFAFLNGAPTFLTLADGKPRPHRVTYYLPEGWKNCATGLPQKAASDNSRVLTFEARDFDQLVDCPTLFGNLTIEEFEVGGKRHRLVNHGGGEFWDVAKAAADLQKIVEVQTHFWECIPYDNYTFLNAVVESGGGLEHSNSTLMLTSRWSFRDPKRYRGWLGLASHEFFHAWNVKRLRPLALGPFDYEREQLTPSLWIVEGITSYYDDLLLKRAGLLTEKQYLENLSRSIGALQVTPGRLVQPLRAASFDAWIKYYRKDENSDNTSISYYTKGAIVGFLLDAAIRRATNDRRSLDDVMRMAYGRYSGERGYTEAEFRSVASEVAEVDLSSWFAQACDSTQELDYTPALDWFGLRFKDPDQPKKDKSAATANEHGSDADADGDEPEEKAIPGWLGLSTKTENGVLKVSKVKRGTPAHAAGLNAGDEVLALDGYRVQGSNWAARRKQYAPGDRASLLISRRGKLSELTVVFAKEPPKRWELQADPEAAESQKTRRSGWLSPAN